MFDNDERVFFQTKVSKRLLGEFRDIQEREGRTARSLIEDYFYQLVEERKQKKERRQRWQTQ